MKRVCEDCLVTSVLGLPVSRTTKAIAAGAIRFFATLRDPGPTSDEPLETCTECGQAKPVVFRYGVDPDRPDGGDDGCVHCGLPEPHPIHHEESNFFGGTRKKDHDFQPKGKPE